MSGKLPSQVEAIAESVDEFARKEQQEKPTAVAGLENAQWVAMDYTDVMVHIFLPDVRAYYDLASVGGCRSDEYPRLGLTKNYG